MSSPLTEQEIAEIEANAKNIGFFELNKYGIPRVLDALLEERFTPDTYREVRECFKYEAIQLHRIERTLREVNTRLERIDWLMEKAWFPKL
jgi:hypothetical protein